VDILSEFFVKVHRQFYKQDIPNLPDELQENFESIFKQVLKIDPYNRRGLKGHDLDPRRELAGCKTFDINYLGDEYRIIYKINDSPGVMRVDVLSFDFHDSAYDKAANRLYRS
jgi:mRNA interferase RelE/StbE